MDLHRTSPERVAALIAIRDSRLGLDGQAQSARLLAAIQSLGAVTTFEASRYLDCFDPRARKMNLIKAGHKVAMAWCITETEAGVRHRIGKYYMTRGEQQ